MTRLETLTAEYISAVNRDNIGLRTRIEIELDQQYAADEARLTAPGALLGAALWYASQGIAVFPCEPRGKQPLGRLVPHGLNDASTDADQIRRWWAAMPDANIGAQTGKQFDVIDIDGHDGIRSTYCQGVTFPPCIGRVMTTRVAGHHVYIAPTGAGNRASIYPAVDYRGKGGYVLVPPSIGANGKRYKWTVPLSLKARGMKPRMLDLFSCQGGAGMGYARAGFEVVSVDIEPQPLNPFEFYQADAFAFLAEHGRKFDAIHASPPCPGYSLLRNQHRNEHPMLIEPIRAALVELGLPYVIENVVGAPLIDPVRLCGEMFGLGVLRHRLFETNWPAVAPAHVPHRGKVRGWRHGTFYDGPYVAVYGDGGGKGTTAEWASALGIDWMDRDGLRESIPPAYTEFIGRQLLDSLDTLESAA